MGMKTKGLVASLVVTVVALAGCNDQSGSENNTAPRTPAAAAKTAPASSPAAASASGDLPRNASGMPLLAEELNCIACHSIEKKVVGPAWADVSKKYKGATTFNYNGKDYPLQEGLIMKVSKGGSGHWGTMPMPANDPSGTKQDKIEKLVKFVLSLEK